MKYEICKTYRTNSGRGKATILNLENCLKFFFHAEAFPQSFYVGPNCIHFHLVSFNTGDQSKLEVLVCKVLLILLQAGKLKQNIP